MHTHTWTPAPSTRRRPSWLQVVGWYFAGGAATGSAWTLVVAVSKVTSRAVGEMLGQALFIAAVVALVRYHRALPRRSLVALVLGAITPFLLVVLFIAYLVWALAHSDWQF